MNYNGLLNLSKEVAAKADPDNLTVVIIGVGTVFVGLVCIVLLCKIIGLFFANKSTKAQQSVAVAPQTANQPIENRQQIIAAVSAVIAEELGTDVSAIRIKSFKKL